MSFYSEKHFSVLDDNILFGKYPCEETFSDLEKYGVNLIVNLTTREEALDPYETDIEVINLPVTDRSTLSREKMREVALQLCKRLYEGITVYIHCRGGHGRSATLAGLTYGLYHAKKSSLVLKMVWEAHQARTEMKARWRKLGAPQRMLQKKQIIKILDWEEKTKFWGIDLTPNIRKIKRAFTSYFTGETKLAFLSEIHSTLLFIGPKRDPREFLFYGDEGGEILVTINSFGISDRAIVAGVTLEDNYQSFSKKQHITIALGSPKAFEEGEVIEIVPLTITGKIVRYTYA